MLKYKETAMYNRNYEEHYESALNFLGLKRESFEDMPVDNAIDLAVSRFNEKLKDLDTKQKLDRYLIYLMLFGYSLVSKTRKTLAYGFTGTKENDRTVGFFDNDEILPIPITMPIDELHTYLVVMD